MSRVDAIVIGAGHNGLTTAGLLAKRGRKVLVLERADFVGGAAAPDEFHPGHRTAGLFSDSRGVRRWVADALGLEAHGLRFRTTPPSVLALGPGSSGILLHGDPARAAEEIAKVSKRDAEQYLAFRTFVDRIRPVLERFLNEAPVNLVDIESIGAWDMLTKGLRIRRLGKADMMELLRLPPMCVADWLGEWFETELLKSALCVPAIAGTFMGPWSPGTNTNLLIAEASAGPGIEGGGAALVGALQKALASLGVEIRTGAEVTEIRVERGKAVGVRVGASESIDAPIVVVGCDPKRALLDLLPVGTLPHRTEHRLSTVRSKGTTAWVHLAVKGRVRFAARPDEDLEFARTGSHVDDVERAFDAVKYRQRSITPILDVHVPTVSDPDLAPAGSSVISIAVHFAPYDLEGGWTEAASTALGDRVVELLAMHVPGLPDAIVGRAVRTPVDIEARYGITGGHIHHGEHALDQILIRPVPECVGYRTPVPGLWLCSSGVHPGGGLTCAPGALAAAAIG
jgi:phytoene dehydrogenase-like protein